jgi:hypothetical protein
MIGEHLTVVRPSDDESEDCYDEVDDDTPLVAGTSSAAQYGIKQGIPKQARPIAVMSVLLALTVAVIVLGCTAYSNSIAIARNSNAIAQLQLQASKAEGFRQGLATNVPPQPSSTTSEKQVHTALSINTPAPTTMGMFLKSIMKPMTAPSQPKTFTLQRKTPAPTQTKTPAPTQTKTPAPSPAAPKVPTTPLVAPSQLKPSRPTSSPHEKSRKWWEKTKGVVAINYVSKGIPKTVPINYWTSKTFPNLCSQSCVAGKTSKCRPMQQKSGWKVTHCEHSPGKGTFRIESPFKMAAPTRSSGPCSDIIRFRMVGPEIQLLPVCCDVASSASSPTYCATYSIQRPGPYWYEAVRIFKSYWLEDMPISTHSVNKHLPFDKNIQELAHVCPSKPKHDPEPELNIETGSHAIVSGKLIIKKGTAKTCLDISEHVTRGRYVLADPKTIHKLPKSGLPYYISEELSPHPIQDKSLKGTMGKFRNIWKGNPSAKVAPFYRWEAYTPCSRKSPSKVNMLSENWLLTEGSHSQMMKCISKKDRRICAFGDSHVRKLFYMMLTKLVNMPTHDFGYFDGYKTKKDKEEFCAKTQTGTAQKAFCNGLKSPMYTKLRDRFALFENSFGKLEPNGFRGDVDAACEWKSVVEDASGVNRGHGLPICLEKVDKLKCTDVVMGFGHWPLQNQIGPAYGPASFGSYGARVRAIVAKVRSLRPEAKIYWVTLCSHWIQWAFMRSCKEIVPVVCHNVSKTCGFCGCMTRRHYMSETVISAFNAIAVKVLQPLIDLGVVTVIDYFDMTHPVEEFTADGNHYGPVPISSEADVLLNEICRVKG